MYSPNRLFAFGMKNDTFGFYNVYANGSIGSAIWNPPASHGDHFVAQIDGNLVL
jgi:hypothetical protein